MTESWKNTSRPPKVGIVGGGQLARMLIQAGISLDLEFHVFALEKDESVKSLTPNYEAASEYSAAALYQFARKCDVVTFEHELVEAQVIQELQERGCVMLPTASTMAFAANKETQRSELMKLKIPVPQHLICNSFSEVESFTRAIQPPFVLKASRMGYDGRGVIFAETLDDVANVLGTGNFEHPQVMEPRLEIEHELSVITVRSTTGEVKAYPVLQSLQKNGICVEVSTSPNVAEETLSSATSYALELAKATGSIGVQAVEFFVTKTGDLMVNELAPRVHNTGHLTIEACATSQFENHLRAILGLPLGDTSLITNAVMVNLVGPTQENRQYIDRNAVLAFDQARLHMYAKAVKNHRKVGHITVLDESVETARSIAWKAATEAFKTEEI